MKKLLLIGGLCSILFSACKKEQIIVEAPFSTNEKHSNLGLNHFESSKDLNIAINQTTTSLRSEGKYNLNDSNEKLFDLVPNDNFRRLLSDDGKFVVSDTLYQITNKGTWFAHISDSSNLSQIVQQQVLPPAEQLRDSLYKIGNVYLFKTFGLDESLNTTEESAEEEIESHGLRNATEEPDIDNFPVKNMNRVTVVGKFIEGLFGTKKDGIEDLRSMKRRRLSGSLYSYNYYVYAERGLMAQVEKKMWHGGWGRLVNWHEGTTIGYHGIIFREEVENLPDEINPFFQNSIGDISVFSAEGGTALEILEENFLLDPADKFAFYMMKSKNKVTQEKIEEIAKKLTKGHNGMSFERLSQEHNTNCVGFTIESPTEKARYTYIKGTSRWKGGPRQVKIIHSAGAEVKWGKMLVGAGLLTYGVTQFTMPSGTLIEIATTLVNQNGSIITGAKMMAESFTSAKSRYHLAGAAYAHTQDGNGYTGMIMYKTGFGK